MPESMKSVEVRGKLVGAMRLDLVGPSDGLGDINEVLPQAPSRWYLTGFLVPLIAATAQKTDQQDTDEQSSDELDQPGEGGGLDDDTTPERAAACQRYLPSSIGLSVIVPGDTKRLGVKITWGDYHVRINSGETWERTPRAAPVTIDLAKARDTATEIEVPESGGLKVAYLARPVGKLAEESGMPSDARTVSVFVVNRRVPKPDDKKDEAFAFQVQLELSIETRFLSRPNLRSLASDDWDERVADLQYRDAGEYAVGHNVATQASVESGECCRVRTEWIPQAEVEYVDWNAIPGAEMSMDALSQLQNSDEAAANRMPIVEQYCKWIDGQAAQIPNSHVKRRDTAQELLQRARVAGNRIEQGIQLLTDPICLEAFRLANKAMAQSVRRRQGPVQGKPLSSVPAPAWRPFQLAFLLMNLPGVAEPTSKDREVVDLLFFPTGGGKTEAYLGLAAFTLILRRLRNPGIGSAGVSVLMRYTLRLLTLDQLSRAATLICALELERRQDVTKLGDWPFEIGLWVGRAATPNRMGKKGDNDAETARLRTIRFAGNDKLPSPIPLEECPWCGTKFKPMSFRLLPSADAPEDLRVLCVNRECQFSLGVNLPIVAVDEPIYRRLPCFMIATVDKFAALPWTGPLGTLVGLYESAFDELCTIARDEHQVRPKIVASTATVRRAETQIRSLFNRTFIEVFPHPAPTGETPSSPASCLPLSATPGFTSASPPRAEAQKSQCSASIWLCSELRKTGTNAWKTQLALQTRSTPT